MSVYDLDTLKDWLEKNRPTIEETYKPIEGKYLLYFNVYPDDENPVENEIEITKSELGNLAVKFTYKIDKEELTFWNGTGTPNFETKLLSVHLKGPEVKVENSDPDTLHFSDSKPIFLLVDLPPTHIHIVDTLCGTIAGFRDPERGSVARLFVMIKLDEKGEKPFNFNLADVKTFFACYMHRSWVRPPSRTSVSKFNHLQLAIQKHRQTHQDYSIY